MMKSLGAAVRISNGSPPASRTASFTTRATPSRWLKQIASSDELLTTAIFGLRMSSSLSPRARHCARRTASLGEPTSKLLLRTRFVVIQIRRILSVPNLSVPTRTFKRGPEEPSVDDGRVNRALAKHWHARYPAVGTV